MKNVSGLLLYVKTLDEINPENKYQIGGKHLGVTNINLDQNFKEIINSTVKIAQEMFEL